MKRFLLALIALSSTLSALEPGEVLDYWLGPPSIRQADPFKEAPKWFRGGKKVDEEIRSLFSGAVHDARYGALLSWRDSPKERLALIILLDQFPRNLYRNSPEAFATDALALTLALDGICNGEDRGLLPVERMFFYLPLMHAEDLRVQNFSMYQYERLLAEAPLELRPNLERSLEAAKKHRDIIARFGRFPHRNEALGRETTAEEEAFLQQPGSSF